MPHLSLLGMHTALLQQQQESLEEAITSTHCNQVKAEHSQEKRGVNFGRGLLDKSLG